MSGRSRLEVGHWLGGTRGVRAGPPGWDFLAGVIAALGVLAGGTSAQSSELLLDRVTVEEIVSPNGLIDGAIEPGETVRIIVSLVNRGAEGTAGITGTLGTASPGVTVLQGTAGCGDAGPDERVECRVPAFEIGVDTGVGCGAVLDFDVELQAGGNPGPVVPFSLQIGLRKPVSHGPPILLARQPFTLQWPMDLVVAGNQWGVLWLDGRSGMDEVWVDVLASDGTEVVGEKQISPAPVRSTPGQIAWDGQGYGVVWLDDRTGVSEDTYFGYADGTGAVQVVKLVHQPTPSRSWPPLIAWDGEGFGITGCDSDGTAETTWFVRMDSQGNEITPLCVIRSVPRVDSASDGGPYGLIWTGEEYVLFTEERPSGPGIRERVVYFLDRTATERREAVRHWCGPDDPGEGNQQCLGWNRGIAWNGRGFGTVEEIPVPWEGNAVYFQRLDPLGRPDGPARRVTEPDLTTPWAQSTDIQETLVTLAWDGFGWGILVGRWVRGHADSDCTFEFNPDCECFYDRRPCDPSQEYFLWVDEEGRRATAEIPLNEPWDEGGSGVIAWNGTEFGGAYSHSKGDLCVDRPKCGDPAFVRMGTEPWCPGPLAPEVSGPGAGYPKRLRVERTGDYDFRLLWEEAGPSCKSYNIYRAGRADYGSGLTTSWIYYTHSPYQHWEAGGWRTTCHIQGESQPGGMRSFLFEGSICNPSWPVWPDCPDALMYFLVSCSNENGEGPVGFDSEGREIAPERKVCFGDP